MTVVYSWDSYESHESALTRFTISPVPKKNTKKHRSWTDAVEYATPWSQLNPQPARNTKPLFVFARKTSSTVTDAVPRPGQNQRYNM